MILPVTNALLSKAETADLLGCTPRTVDRLDLQPAAHHAAPNGRQAPLFAVASLPAEAQTRWIERQNPETLPLATRLALGVEMPDGRNLSPEDLAEAERRFGIIEPLLNPDRFRALWAECEDHKSAVIRRIGQNTGASTRTLYNWLSSWSESGFAGLVPRDRSDKGRSRVLNQAAREFILAAAMPRKGQYGLLSVRDIFRAYTEERAWRAAHGHQRLGSFEATKYARYIDANGCLSGSAQLPEASYQTFRRCFNRLPEVARVMARDGEEAFHNTQEPISWRDYASLKPLDYVVMDHRRLDIFCLARTREGWRLIRPWLTAAIDMRTRKWLATVIVETPSSDSIAAALKRVFIDYGLPANVYWDNGKDFTCEWLEGKHTRSAKGGRIADLNESWRGVLNTLGVRVHHAIVKRARAKLIEPNFLNIAHFDRNLPEWCGHKPAARPERLAEMVAQHEAWERKERDTTPFRTIEEIAALYSDFIEHDVNEREHSGEGMRDIKVGGGFRWMCPNEAWEKLIGSVERRTVPADTLRFCFAKRKELTVQHGELKITRAGNAFHYRLAGNDRALMALNGKTVQFAYDPLDLGEAAVYFEERFVGLAHCLQLRRMGESAFIEDERTRRAARREVKRFIKAVHEAVPVADPETRLQRRKAVQPARESVERVQITASLPAAIVEAEAAEHEDRGFRFSESVADVACSTPAPEVSDDDEFRFFRGTDGTATE